MIVKICVVKLFVSHVVYWPYLFISLLFWTDWDGEMPRIERVAMSGQRETRQIIFDIRNVSGSGWPNGLALDYENRRLYWVDARWDSCSNSIDITAFIFKISILDNY